MKAWKSYRVKNNPALGQLGFQARKKAASDLSVIKLMRLVFILVLMYGLDSCTGSKVKNNLVASIKVRPTEKPLLTSEFTDLIEIVPLEEKEESLLARVNKLLVYNGCFIIIDKVLSKAIYIFNRDGHYLTKINCLGKGPGEYTSIADVAIHKGMILLYDGSMRRLLRFSLSGNFIDEKNIGLLANEIGSSGNLIVFNCWQYNELENGSRFQPGLIGYNETTGRFFQIMEYCKNYLKVPVTNGLYNKGDSLFLCSPVSDTIYYISKVSTPILHIDFGQYSTPVDYRDLKPGKTFAEDIQNMNHVTGKASFCYSNNFLSLVYTVGLNKYYCLKTSDRIIEGYSLVNDILPVGLTDPMFVDDEYLYFLTINSEINKLRQLKDPKTIQEFQKLLSNDIKEFKSFRNENPYIV
ncbi:MAG: 6-bladed beta-propeller, partial [Bacteroidales bacterium]|nr:6-bladed beta-propeller [Bacteroidales bacterium]